MSIGAEDSRARLEEYQRTLARLAALTNESDARLRALDRVAAGLTTPRPRVRRPSPTPTPLPAAGGVGVAPASAPAVEGAPRSETRRRRRLPVWVACVACRPCCFRRCSAPCVFFALFLWSMWLLVSLFGAWVLSASADTCGSLGALSVCARPGVGPQLSVGEPEDVVAGPATLAITFAAAWALLLCVASMQVSLWCVGGSGKGEGEDGEEEDVGDGANDPSQPPPPTPAAPAVRRTLEFQPEE
jgi:hypothetical protein